MKIIDTFGPIIIIVILIISFFGMSVVESIIASWGGILQIFLSECSFVKEQVHWEISLFGTHITIPAIHLLQIRQCCILSYYIVIHHSSDGLAFNIDILLHILMGAIGIYLFLYLLPVQG